MQYHIRVDGESGPRGCVITPYATRAAAALALEQELARLRARGATVAGDAWRGYIAAYESDGAPTILHLALEQAP